MTIPVQYPSTARPARIVRKFTAPGGSAVPHEGVDLYAPRGTPIVAGAAGVVQKVILSNDQLNYGAYVTVLTKTATDKIRVFYAGLKDIAVAVGQNVKIGQLIGYSKNSTVKIVIQAPKDQPYPGFPLRYVAHPNKHLMMPRMRLQPTDNRLRLRKTPSLDGKVVGFVNQWDLLETPMNDYKVLRDVGKDGKWLKVVNPFNESQVVYAAAWFLKAISLNDSPGGIPDVPIRGMNLDRFHTLGTPDAAPLRNLGWVRLLYNMSYNPENNSYGNTDLNATYARYLPIFQRYATNGNKIICIFNHQTYGEAQGYVWDQMTPGQWDNLITSFVFYVRQIAQQWASSGLIYAYQIWNEQDSPPTNQAAVPMPATIYAKLFTQTARAIRAVDPKVKIITGGHVTGTSLGVNYARAALAAIPSDAQPDGLGVHPYLTGPKDSPFSYFGTIDDALRAWSGVLPGKPLWLTEWGILDKQGDDSVAGLASEFAEGFIKICQTEFRGLVACAVWYAWADSMHNGYGLVRTNNTPRQPLYNKFLGL